MILPSSASCRDRLNQYHLRTFHAKISEVVSRLPYRSDHIQRPALWHTSQSSSSYAQDFTGPALFDHTYAWSLLVQIRHFEVPIGGSVSSPRWLGFWWVSHCLSCHTNASGSWLSCTSSHFPGSVFELNYYWWSLTLCQWPCFIPFVASAPGSQPASVSYSYWCQCSSEHPREVPSHLRSRSTNRSLCDCSFALSLSTSLSLSCCSHLRPSTWSFHFHLLCLSFFLFPLLFSYPV